MKTNKFKSLIFCDLDNTLIHPLNSGTKNHVPIIDGTDESMHIRSDVVNLLDQLVRDGQLVVLITGRRSRSHIPTNNVVPHSASAIEHGGLIFHTNDLSLRDMGWERKHMEALRWNDMKSNSLWGFQEYLSNLGYATDSIGRELSFRVRGSEKVNGRLLFNELEQILESDESLSKSLSLTGNGEHVDILPVTSGKVNAAEYLCDYYHISKNRTYALGDDLNDLGMLRWAAHSFCPANSKNRVKEALLKCNGYISQHSGADGAFDILTRISGMINLYGAGNIQ